LCDLGFFLEMYTPVHKYDLSRYWRAIEKHTRHEVLRLSALLLLSISLSLSL
jgi:hypothetical protein